MTDQTANTEADPVVPSVDGQQDAGQSSPDTQGVDSSQAARAKETELLTKIATLEKAMDEMRIAKTTYPRQPQGVDQAQLQAAMESIAEGDASTASQRLENVLNAAGGNLTQEAVQQMKAYLTIERDLNEKAVERPYMKQFRPLVEQQISNYITAGYDPKAATDAAIRDYDTQFNAYNQAVQPKQVAVPMPTPPGAQGMTGQGPPIQPPPKAVPDTPESYINSRIASKMSRIGGIRP